MTKAAIMTIVFGAMLFVLGAMPGLTDALIAELQSFRDHFSTLQGPIHELQPSGQIWLLVAGGAVMIAGLLALLAG